MITDQAVHLKHIDPRLLEYSLHLLVTQYLALVLGILQVVAFDMLP